LEISIQENDVYGRGRKRKKKHPWQPWLPILLVIMVISIGYSVYPTKPTQATQSVKAPIKATQQVTQDSPKIAPGAEEKVLSQPAPNTMIKQAKLPDGIPAGKMIASIPLSKPTVYLTFDDGPSEHLKQIVDILDQNQIKGSFFWIGNNVKDGEFAKTMIKEGHVIGTHTMNHTALNHKSLEEQTKIIEETTKYVSERIGHPIIYFRPPYGAVDENTYKASIATGQVLTYWDVDSEDWKYPHNPKKILANISSETKPGSIILMHEKPQTVELLPQIIALLKAKGYEFAPLPAPKEN
jgi:peptidoglycan-N-acetylglucosamine deacetylase